MDQLIGYFLYFCSLLAVGGIYSLIALGLNVQWGFAGLFNVGIAGFVSIGAYTYALLTTDTSPLHYGGLGLPLAVGIVAAMVASGLISAIIGVICIRLRSDYLAIATIGIAEIIKLVLKNNSEITNGPRGINKIPRLWENFTEERFYNDWPMSWFASAETWQSIFSSLPRWWWQPCFALSIIIAVYVVYRLLEKLRLSPWGRMMTAIRENEPAAHAAGKNVTGRRIEAFILGSMIMGLAGAVLAMHLRLIEPTNTFDPSKLTFLVWLMLIAGGSGNNRGAILGSFLIWVIWSASEIVINVGINVIDDFTNIHVGILSTRAGYLRMLLIGLLLQYILQKYPLGILPESRPTASSKT